MAKLEAAAAEATAEKTAIATKAKKQEAKIAEALKTSTAAG